MTGIRFCLTDARGTVLRRIWAPDRETARGILRPTRDQLVASQASLDAAPVRVVVVADAPEPPRPKCSRCRTRPPAEPARLCESCQADSAERRRRLNLKAQQRRRGTLERRAAEARRQASIRAGLNRRRAKRASA